MDTPAEASLVLVAAVGRNRAIGRAGGLIWRLRSDLRRFRAITTGRPLIMGRKTWDSIGRPLPGRPTVVVSRNPDFAAEGALVAPDIERALAMAQSLARDLQAAELIIAGGGEIYRQTMGRAARLRLTEVDSAPDADAFFPSINTAVWREVFREDHQAGPDDEAGFSFVDYERRTTRAS